MLIDIRSLSLKVGDHQILHDVHLALNAGEIYGLVGPNGAGKTTTIAAAMGLLNREGGTISVLGDDPGIDARSIRARCGVLPEQNGFYDWMNAADYLGFFARLYAFERTLREIQERLTQVGLEPHPRQTIGTFSRGMRQRLGLARALIGNPELLVLDEPTNGLDPRGRREIHNVLIELSRRGVGILLCTHLLDDVDRLCHRIGLIVHGRTVAEGTLAELIQKADKRTRFRVRLGGPLPKAERGPSHVSIVAEQGDWAVVDLDPGIAPAVAWRELLLAGWPVVEIHAAGGGLEDLYLSLTEDKAA